uniref:protein kinase domain-containing protein n=1 Tax=Segatella hominis TaxID=2518605 RepID=UPI00403871D8
MQYPLISQYVRAIQDASSNLDKLAHLEPVLDDHGEPYRSSGAFAVVFKMKDEQTGKCYALKCFTEEQEGRAEAYRQIADELEFVDSSYITSVKYLDKEIFVDSSCEEDEFPVLLMDWIDGETMENYIAENYQDNYAMAMLCYRFCKMAAWLRSQPFAHGDIKPDNIMVRPDGSLTLIDYDGMFVPAMKGQKSPTIGTKDFSHPLRTVDDFDETIDDFALASVALSLKAISLEPSLLDDYGAADRLLFSADDYHDLSRSKVMSALQELMNDEELATLLSMFLFVKAKKNFSLSFFHAFFISKPFNVVENLIKQADMLFEKSKAEVDHKKAFHLYSIANSKGSLYAKACLGYCFCLGKGVTEDKEKGLALIRVSANAGNAKGQNTMGLCYGKGLGLAQSYEEAVKWYRKSAAQGYARAQYNLGVCYAKGQGVPQS